MFHRSILPAALVLAIGVPAALSQPAPPPLPAQGPAPLLYVRFAGPAGLRVAFYRGPTAIPLDAPVTAGLRPGYLYRVKLTGWPEHPGLTLYPTLEVRGSLHLSPKVNGASYPAPVEITPADLERVRAGSLVTKVVYLECPDLAYPVATRPDQPLELDFPPGHDLLAEARDRGRVMLILRLGQRQVGDDELARESIPGTVLLPGEKVLSRPAHPPWIPWAGVRVFDPFLGPKPLTEECLHDGGDTGAKAGFDRDGRLVGVDPSDALAEYADSKGHRHLAVSNRVCLCVPRYAVLRGECPVAGYDTVFATAGAHKVQGQVQLEMRVPSREAEQYKPPAAVQGRKRPTEAVNIQKVALLTRVEVLEAHQIEIGPAMLLGTKAAVTLTEVQRARLLRQLELARELSNRKGPQEIEQVERTAVIGRAEGLDVISTSVETRDLTCVCGVPIPPDKPLFLCKWADAQAAQVGDVVTFYLKYSNHGGQPITDVAVVDSLTGRLEYVAGSAKADRPAVFTTQENEAGSVILRWEISGRLLPGQNGVVSFQARIR